MEKLLRSRWIDISRFFFIFYLTPKNYGLPLKRQLFWNVKNNANLNFRNERSFLHCIHKTLSFCQYNSCFSSHRIHLYRPCQSKDPLTRVKTWKFIFLNKLKKVKQNSIFVEPYYKRIIFLFTVNARWMIPWYIRILHIYLEYFYEYAYLMECNLALTCAN